MRYLSVRNFVCDSPSEYKGGTDPLESCSRDPLQSARVGQIRLEPALETRAGLAGWDRSAGILPPRPAPKRKGGTDPPELRLRDPPGRTRVGQIRWNSASETHLAEQGWVEMSRKVQSLNPQNRFKPPGLRRAASFYTLPAGAHSD